MTTLTCHTLDDTRRHCSQAAASKRVGVGVNVWAAQQRQPQRARDAFNIFCCLLFSVKLQPRRVLLALCLSEPECVGVSVRVCYTSVYSTLKCALQTQSST